MNPIQIVWIAALILTLLSIKDWCPLWVPVLLICILGCLPLR